MITYLARLLHMERRWFVLAIVLMILQFLLFLGFHIELFQAESFAIFGLIGVLIVFLFFLVKPETSVLLLLITLSLGTETLDIFKFVKEIPGFRVIHQITDTGSLTFFDLLISLCIVSVFLRHSVRKSHYRKGEHSNLSVGNTLAIYLIVGFLTTVIACFRVEFARIEWSLLYFVRLLFTCLPYVVVVAAQPSQAWLKRFTKLYILLALVPAIRIVWKTFEVRSGDFPEYYRLETESGFSAMGLGTYLGSVVGICLAIIQAKGGKTILSTRLAWLFLFISISAMVLTQKRAPLVGFLGIIIVWAILQRQLSRQRRLLIVLVLLALLVVGGSMRGGILDRMTLSGPGIPPWLLEVNQRELLPEPFQFIAYYNLDPNITARIGQWFRSLQAFAEYPFGVGFRSMILSPYSYPHNQYLQILAEFGLVGLVCFFWLICNVLKLAFKLYRSRETLSYMLGSGVFYGFVGMLVQGMFEESFHNWDGMALLWLLTGLATVQFRLMIANNNLFSISR